MLFIGILPNQNILICWYNDILTRADEAESISHAFLSIVCVCVCVCVCFFFEGGGLGAVSLSILFLILAIYYACNVLEIVES